MMLTINGRYVEISQLDTEIYGLKFKPQFVGMYNNDADEESFTTRRGIDEVTQRNFDLMKEVSAKYMTHGVIEIGVSRNGDGSFTKAILDNKPDTIPYLGIDIEDKRYLNSDYKKIYTITENSLNQQAVRNYAKEIGMDKISLLFIDGWHSLNTVINDWMYADMLSDDAVVMFHDTNNHPGPTAFLPAIDETKFRVEKFFENENDYGMSIAYKLNQ